MEPPFDPAERFRRWFAAVERTKADVAREVGCTPEYIAMILDGVRKPGIDIAVGIRRATSSGWDEEPIAIDEWVGYRPAHIGRTGTEG